MAHVEFTGRIRKHLKGVILGLGFMRSHMVYPFFLPNLLPLRLKFFKIILIFHVQPPSQEITVARESINNSMTKKKNPSSLGTRG
jgi:hypothetical protein